MVSVGRPSGNRFKEQQTPMKEFKTPKSKETYFRVLDSAMTLFSEKGYEKTTMRAISKEAKLGLGALYYYFPSKEAIITTFYEQLQQELQSEWAEKDDAGLGLNARVKAFLKLKFGKLEPYRPLLKVLLKEAVDPDSALSPFSADSRGALDGSLSIFQSMVRVDGDKEKEEERMAKLLWMGHLGLIALWVHKPEKIDKAIDAFADLAPFLSMGLVNGPMSDVVEELIG